MTLSDEVSVTRAVLGLALKSERLSGTGDQETVCGCTVVEGVLISQVS